MLHQLGSLRRLLLLAGLCRNARPLAIGAAWFFMLFSLTHLAWVISVKWADPAGVTSLYQTTVDGSTYRAWGLAYPGTFGLLLAITQAAVVTAAAVMSLRLKPQTRRLGHGILIAWAALWLLNLVRLAAIDLHVDSLCQASIMAFLFAGTVYRAMHARAVPPPRQHARPLIVLSTDLSSDDVLGSDEVRDITDRVKPGLTRQKPARLSLRPAITGTHLVLHHVWSRAKPIAAFACRGAAAGRRRITAYLRDKGVIPPAKRSTVA